MIRQFYQRVVPEQAITLDIDPIITKDGHRNDDRHW